MPPPKLKLYKTGKLKATLSKPASTTVSQTTDGSSPIATSELDSETVRQFELELAWCIQTMESSLNGGKLNASQVQDTTKTLKILKSSNQSLIRKRQLMRSSFGDYRAKMAEEEKKLRLGRRQIQFSNQTNSKSFFVKRSVLSTIGKDKDFKFDFPVTTEQLIENLNLNCDGSKAPQHNNGISYAGATDNSFRFNFDIAEETTLLNDNVDFSKSFNVFSLSSEPKLIQWETSPIIVATALDSSIEFRQILSRCHSIASRFSGDTESDGLVRWIIGGPFCLISLSSFALKLKL